MMPSQSSYQTIIFFFIFMNVRKVVYYETGTEKIDRILYLLFLYFKLS